MRGECASPLSWFIALCLFGMALATARAADLDTAVKLKKLSLEELMNVDVTSVSRKAEPLIEAPSAIQVITGEQIRRSGAATLPEVLRLAANLHVARASSHEWAISARGFNNLLANKLLVMIDGRTVYTPLFAGVFWDVQDTLLEDIDRIEVISGPGASVWGANAVNGVINILTKSARETQGLYLSGGGGNEIPGMGAFRWGGKLSDDAFYRVYGKYFRIGATAFPSGVSAGNDWDMGQAGFRVDWEPGAINRVTFQGDLYEGWVSQLGAADQDLAGGNLLGRWKHDFESGSEMVWQAYFDRTHRHLPDVFDENLNTYDVDFQHRIPVGERQEIQWGLGYRLIQDDVVNSPTLAFLPPQVTHQLFSGFAQDTVDLVPDRLALTVGTKLEHNDYTEFEVEPSARLAWHLNTNQTLWTALSRAVRTPSRVDRDYYIPGESPHTVLQGGPTFHSEEVISYELGYRARLHDRVSGSISGFANWYDDLRSVEPVQPPAAFPVQVGNGFTGFSYGVELAGEYAMTDWWRWRAGYTWFHLDVSSEPSSRDPSAGRAESNDVSHMASLQSEWSLPGNVEFDAALRYVGRIQALDVPPYTELNLRLGWKPAKNWEISISGRNLLHDRHAEFGSPGARQEVERSVLGMVTWRF